MKTASKYILMIAVLSAIFIGIFLIGITYSTIIPKIPVEQQTNTDINHNFSGESLNFYAGDLIGNITITAKIPESPLSLNTYKGVYREGDLVNVLPETSQEGGNVPSEIDAPEIAKSILNNYGGLPSDAKYGGATTIYLYKASQSTGEFVKADALYTSVSWWRMLNGKRIVGDTDGIYIELGNNSEPLRINKQWRNYTYAGNVAIIPVTKAITKLKDGDVISPPLDNKEDINIYGITLGYYVKGLDMPEVILEPVWIFYGNTSSGSYLSLEVYARQFANFTATPTYGKAPLTVTFTDISDASPVKWNWDFGDGSTSTEQNPVHTFQTDGAYTVTLKATNDIGSDTMKKTSFVLIGKKAIVQHIDTKLDDLITMLNAMTIDQGIKNSLTQKLENAKAKNGDALKFVDQNKEDQANNMLNAEDNLIQAFVNEVDAQAGKGITAEDAAKLNADAAEIRDLIQKAIETPI